MQRRTSFAEVKPRVDTGLRGRQIAGPDWKDMSSKRDAGSRSRSRSTASRVSLQNRGTTSVASKTLVESPTSSKLEEDIEDPPPAERSIIYSRILDLIGRQIKGRHPHAEPATSLQSGKEYYTIHVISLSMDPVLLKRSLRSILKSLGLHGTILRHEIDQNGQSQFATFIAFEALVSKGTEYVEQIITHVKQLEIIRSTSTGFSADYCQLTACTSEHPVVTGISIAETSSLYARQGSSGLKYDNPYVSKSHEMVETVSSDVEKYITPAVGIVQHFAGTASGSGENSDAINNLLTSFTAPPRFKVRYHDSPWLFPVTLPGPISNMSTVILEGLGALDGQHPESDSVCNNWLVFDKHKLHLPTPEALDRLPQGSELIFVPSTVARPSKAKETL